MRSQIHRAIVLGCCGVALSAIGSFAFGPLAFGQDGCVVEGSVQDPVGAAIAGALVTVEEGSSGAKTETKTDAGGVFRMAAPCGAVTLRVEAKGFAPSVQTVTPDAGGSSAGAGKLAIQLEIPTGQERVEVTSNALAVETASTQLGETIEGRTAENMPLNGRSFTDLMAVQPGIVPQNTAQPGAVVMTGVATTPPSGDANPGNLSISGQRETSNGFRVNGSDVEEDVNMGTSILPNLDSIESFRVLTSNVDAEYGNSSGGQVLVTTRPGTDKVHGSAFEFLRNTALDARNYFSGERAAYRQNQFGTTLGGKILGGRLALFADYQGTRLTEGIDTGEIAVPTSDERAGQFGAGNLPGSVSGPYWAGLLTRALGYTVTAGEPYAQVFPSGAIPQSAWSAPAKYLLASIPTPNASAGVFETSAQAETLQDDKGALRADIALGTTTLTGYSFADRYSLLNPYPTGTGGANVPGFSATSNGLAQLESISGLTTLNGNAFNEFRVSYMRNANSVGQPKGGVGPSLADQGFSGIATLNPSTVGIENVAFNEYTIGVDTTALVQAENIYEISDAYSRNVGRHALKFGGEMHANQINTHPDVIFNGSFGFNGSETGVDFADFLLGIASSFTQGQAQDFYNRNLYIAGFAEDSWKAANRLTVNAGVRWDRIRPWDEKYNQLQTLVLGEQSVVFPGAPQGLVFPGDRGVPRSLAGARENFSPRVGVVWNPDFKSRSLKRLTGENGKTSVRAGYGIFYTAYEGLSAGIMSANPPYGFTYTSSAPPLFASPFTVADTGANVGQRFPLQHVAFGASAKQPNSSVNWSEFEPLVGIPAVDPRDVTPYAEHWMTSVERQFGSSTMASVTYIGTAAHHLLVLEEANPANPQLCLSMGAACGPFNEQAARTRFGPDFGSVELQRTIANSGYNALDAMLVRRSRTFDMLASYTYSKSLDQSTGLPEPVNPVDPSLSRGLSSFDLRHNFVTSFTWHPEVSAANRTLHQIASGWALSGLLRLASGLPVTLLNNNDTSLLGTIPNGINNNGVDTPEWTGNSLSIHTNPRGGGAVFDASQFSLPQLGTVGNARRRFFSGPGMENLDTTVSRTFQLKNEGALELRGEAFNIANHAQFFGAAAVEGNISSSTFGQAVSAMPPRLMQLAVKYRF